MVAHFSPVEPARLLALEILRRHELLGTFARFRRREATAPELFNDAPPQAASRLVASRPLVFFSMVLFHAEAGPGGRLLVVDAAPSAIGRSVGLEVGVVYPALRALESAGIVGRVRRGVSGDRFQVNVPRIPGEDRVEPPRSDPEPARAREPAHRVDSDPARAPEPARALKAPDPEPARAPDPARALNPESARAPEPAHRVGSDPARAPEPARALDPHFSSKNEECEDGEARLARARVRQSDQISLTDGAGAAEAEKCRQLLESTAIAGKRLDAGGVRKLLKSPNCTVANIEASIRFTRAQLAAGKARVGIRYFFRLVQDGCTVDVPDPKIVAEQAAAAAFARRVADRQLELTATAARLRVQQLIKTVSDADLSAAAARRVADLSAGTDEDKSFADLLQRSATRLRSSPLWAHEWLTIYGAAGEAAPGGRQ